MKTIQLNNIPINIHDGPIGLSLSGGADSAILAYILMKYSTEDIYFFTLGNKEKNFISIEHATKIINYLVSVTGKLNVYHNVKYVENQTRDNLLEYLNSFSSTVTKMYTATTSFPDQTIMDQFNTKLPNEIIDRRNPLINKSLYSKDNFFYSPFYNGTKKEISYLYDFFDLSGTLLPLTRSCESTTIYNKHCGNCWWCEERFWAFGSL